MLIKSYRSKILLSVIRTSPMSPNPVKLFNYCSTMNSWHLWNRRIACWELGRINPRKRNGAIRNLFGIFGMKKVTTSLDTPLQRLQNGQTTKPYPSHLQARVENGVNQVRRLPVDGNQVPKRKSPQLLLKNCKLPSTFLRSGLSLH